MEFTEQEIERFTKAKQWLQEEWNPQVGDWFCKADGLGHGIWLICRIRGATLWCAGEGMSRAEFGNRLVEFMAPQNYTWIPSVEKLLAMILDSAADAQAIGRILMEFNMGEAASEISEVISRIRLLLLNTVMHEKYQRKWDGQAWIKKASPKKQRSKAKK